MLFALLSEGEERMLREWAFDLGLRGWTPEETWEASDWLSRNAPPQYRSQHLKALQDRLPMIRRQKALDARPPEPDRGTCVDCQGDGLISVPSLRDDPLNRGIFYTHLVACHCALGRWKQQHCFGEKGIIDLSEYEASNPDWRQQMEAYRKLQRRQAGTQTITQEQDQKLGAIRSLARGLEESMKRHMAAFRNKGRSKP